ncbi:MAG TPA: glycosyltransferase, partial [Rubrobacter sp.]
MLESVDIGRQSIDDYEASAGRERIERLRSLAEPLRGARVLHLNATPYGGGVAEILRSEVPLLRDLGLNADWKIITGDKDFFSVTKTMHNALQGHKRSLTDHEKEIYLTYSTRNAHLLEGEYDLIVVHDPQPLAIPQFHGRAGAKWIWRCHIDTSEPNGELWAFLHPYLDDYDAAVFTLQDFVPPAFPVPRVEIIPPAIDPESPKNIELPSKIAERILGWLGVEIGKPLVTQVSRFDPWKDQPGVIEAYRMVKEEIPELKLALVGSMALDDPEGWEVYRQIKEAALEDPDIDIFTNLTGVSNVEVNAFQRFSDACVQKSIREGFGLVVSETLWKGTPMVAGEAGGIPMQMPGGAGGFLVGSARECAEKLLYLLRNPEEGALLALSGKDVVRERFLLPRLISDELVLYASLLG